MLLLMFTLGFNVWRTTAVLIRSTDCGIERGCFYDCSESDCDFIVYWRYRPEIDSVEISMNKKLADIYKIHWFALGLSDDRKMGADSVLECTMDQPFFHFADVRHSYNDHNYNLDVYNAKNGLRHVTGQVVDSILTCNFTRTITVAGNDKIFNLDRPWYLFVASGLMSQDTKLKHNVEPSLSPYQVDLKEHQNVDGHRVYYLVKLHGCLMVFSWMMLASVAVVLARYFKQAWPHDKLCGRPAWFQIHRLVMLTTVICVSASFIIIWYDTGKYSELRGASTFQRAHPVLGVVVMGLTLLNPIMALLKPATGTVSRPLFRYAHGFIGTAVYMIAVLNIALGTTLEKSGTSGYTLWVVVAFGAYQFVIEAILETHNCYLIKSGQKAAFEMKQSTPVEESMSSLKQEPPGIVFKKSLLAFHVVVVLGVGTTCLFLVAM